MTPTERGRADGYRGRLEFGISSLLSDESETPGSILSRPPGHKQHLVGFCFCSREFGAGHRWKQKVLVDGAWYCSGLGMLLPDVLPCSGVPRLVYPYGKHWSSK